MMVMPVHPSLPYIVFLIQTTMKSRLSLIVLMLIFFSPILHAQDGQKEQKQRSDFLEKALKLITYDVTKLDTNYISVADRQWLVMLNSVVSKTNVDIKTPDIYVSPAMSEGLMGLVPVGENIGRLKIDASTPYSYRLGFYLSYGKLGGGYNMALTNHNDQEFNFKFNGNRFGMDLRYHKTKKIEGEFEFDNMDRVEGIMLERVLSMSDEEIEEMFQKMEEFEKKMEEAENIEQGNIQITSFVCNMHYVFNHKKFSYAAAMKPKKIQLKSAGSWLLGSSIYYMQFKAVDDELVTTFNGLNRFNSFFFALGGGYGYNWVTCKRKLMFHGSIMPMLMYSIKSNAGMKNRAMTDEERTRLKEVTKTYLGGKSHITYAGVARASAVYQLSSRYVAGVDATFDIFKIGRSPRYETLARDLIMHAYLGYRF